MSDKKDMCNKMSKPTVKNIQVTPGKWVKTNGSAMKMNPKVKY